MVREMVSKWLWQPAKLNGVPVPSIETHAVGFKRVPWQVGVKAPEKKKK
jgi:hypothetical protein